MEERRQLLIVDDMKVNRVLLKTILCDDYEITEAEDGEQALAVLKEDPKRFKGVILDIIMPKKDGFQVLQEMRSSKELKDIPVIIVTAESGANYEIKALEMGATDFLNQPLEPSIVRLRIRNIRNLLELDEMKLQEEYRRVEEEQRKELEKKEIEYLQICLEAENLVTKCVKKLYSDLDDRKAMDEVLAVIGDYLGADRAYVIKIKEKTACESNEWCQTGIKSHSQYLEKVPMMMEGKWKQELVQKECVLLEDTGKLKEAFPQEYHKLQSHGIKGVMAAPIYLDSELRGYIGVDNYRPEKLLNAKSILSAIGYFIGSMYRYKEAMERLEYLSYHDNLTVALNRNAYTRDIALLGKSQKHSVGVVYTDVNGMKEINDSEGHKAGDLTLIQVADQITAVFGPEHFYRVGGDEFVVILSDIGEVVFWEKVQTLKNKFEFQHRVKVAVGGAWASQAAGLEDLLTLADGNMYADKKDYYSANVVSRRYRHRLDDLLKLTTEGVLQQELDQSRMAVFYQPKFSSVTLSLSGAEALVRYQDHDGKLVMPDRFIPLLEEARMISLLDFYMFRKVCAAICEWMDQGLAPVTISVNFSRHTICMEGFAAKLQEAWEQCPVPKEYLEVEITETVEEDDLDRFSRIVRRIREYGFRVAVDDFGVRNANLAFFTAVDFDVLKVDRSILSVLPENQKSLAILTGILSICKGMDIRTVAEGIETEEQKELLQRLECDELQGYYFSKPVSSEKFRKDFLEKKSDQG